MAYSRYSIRNIFTNNDLGYRDAFFVERDVEMVKQYNTSRTRYPTAKEMGKLSMSPYRWQADDRLFKLADTYYGRPDLWWIIAWFNRKPLEAHFEVGETILVPQPLSEALYLYERTQKS